MLVVALALAAALLFALGTVLQQRAAVSQAAGEQRARAGLLLRLARRPVWLAGIVSDALGFAAQAAALGLGRLIVVQPLLASSVVFALPLGARLNREPVRRSEVLAALVVTASLAAFLVLIDPAGGRDDAPVSAWLVTAAVTAAVTVPLVAIGVRRRPAVKAAMVGTATGILFGLSAALTKATVDRLDGGVVAVLADWHVYALVAVGYVSMTLSQVSLETGALAPAVATSMSLDPIASVVLGVTLLQERLHETALGTAASALSVAAMLAGLVALAVARGGGQPAGGSSRSSSANRAAERRRE
jgi:drug/metabolite transporter (DMT)-like permease